VSPAVSVLSIRSSSAGRDDLRTASITFVRARLFPRQLPSPSVCLLFRFLSFLSPNDPFCPKWFTCFFSPPSPPRSLKKSLPDHMIGYVSSPSGWLTPLSNLRSNLPFSFRYVNMASVCDPRVLALFLFCCSILPTNSRLRFLVFAFGKRFLAFYNPPCGIFLCPISTVPIFYPLVVCRERR